MPATLPIHARHWQPQLGASGEVVHDVDDVEQCLRVILTTPRGADPLRPRFGCDAWEYIDLPVTEARPYLTRAIHEAIDEWEPRAKLVRVQLVDRTAAAGHVGVIVQWRLTVHGGAVTTERNTNFATGDFSR